MMGKDIAENDGIQSSQSLPSKLSAGKKRPSLSRLPALSARDDTYEPAKPAKESHDTASTPEFKRLQSSFSNFGLTVPVDRELGRSSTKQKNTTGRDSSPSIKTPVASKPITIAVPSYRKRQFHTPLSARGDLIGGYFPLHEASQQSLETHPFNKPHTTEFSKMHSDSSMSNTSVLDPSQHSSPYRPHYTTQEQTFNMSNQAPETPPLVSMPPLGKYHPANYRNKTPDMTLRQPRSQTSSQRPIPPQHERTKSNPQNNKQLLQKYQREMVEQATRAARRAGAVMDDPAAPKLTPLGSPGPVTPMELEESNVSGYLVAGAKRGSSYRQGESTRETDMVERMIRAEEERRRREGQSSPVATAGGF